MARIDKLKEEIGRLKIIFAILTATDISLVAWVVQNYGKAVPILLTSVIIWINRVAYRKINELEEL